MKILLLLTGQLRTFDYPDVQKSWKKFFNTYQDVTTVGSFWYNRGCSLYGGDKHRHDEILDIEYVKDKMNTDYVKLFDYNQYMENLYDRYKQYIGLKHSFDCIISHSFVRYQVLNLFNSLNLGDFDVAILGRADLIFLRQINDHYLNDTSVLWHQNGVDSKAHYPKRIYDMLCISNTDNILKMCEFYNDDDSNISIDLPSHNGLTVMDSTRIYYNYLNQKNIPHDSMDLLYADVYRGTNDLVGYSSNFLNNKELWGVTS